MTEWHLDMLLNEYPLQAVAVICYTMLLGYYLLMWSKYGRDPHAGKITPLTEPPDGLTPAAMRCLREHELDTRGIAALLCGLAIKGYVKITCSKANWGLTNRWTLLRRYVHASPAALKLRSVLADGRSNNIMALADILDVSPNGVRETAAELAKQGVPVELSGDRVHLRESCSILTRTLPAMDHEETLLYTHLVAKRAEILLEDQYFLFIKDGMAPAKEAVKEAYGGDKYFLANQRIIIGGWLFSLLLAVVLAVIAMQPGMKDIKIATSEGGDIWVAYVVGGLYALIGISGVTYLGLPAWAQLGKPTGRSCGIIIIALAWTVLFGGFFLAGSITALAASGIWGIFLLCALITNRIFSPLLKSYTPTGRQLRDKVENFRKYLTGQHQTDSMVPALTLDIFERYLPYAIALEAEYEWAKQYQSTLSAGTQGYQPSWYESDRWNPDKLSGEIARFTEEFSGTISSASTPPSSSS